MAIDHPTLKHLLRGMYNIKPSRPRTNNEVWDANIVLCDLALYPSYDDIFLPKLAIKTCLLILLSTMCRKAVLSNLSLDKMTWSADDVVEFELLQPCKQANMRNLLHTHTHLELAPYTLDRRLCPVTCLCEYIYLSKHI